MHGGRPPDAWRISMLLPLLAVLACSTAQTPRSGETASQQAQDQRTRERVAAATQRAKEKSEELGQKLDIAGERLAEKARAAAQGVKDGLHRDKYPLDLNSAPESDLSALPSLNPND